MVWFVGCDYFVSDEVAGNGVRDLYSTVML